MRSTPEFFNVQPVQMALETLFVYWTPRLRTERLDPRDALSRVLASPAYSPIDLPEFPRSTMDGYAVRAADTFGASQSLPAYLTCVGVVGMGTQANQQIEPGQTLEIHTGGMLPPGVDAVVMIERTQRISKNEIEILAPVAPGENVVQVGEDVAQNAPILPAGHALRPVDIGGLLAVGLTQVEVSALPRVGILSCGDELIEPESATMPGQIRDINAHVLAGLVSQAGGTPVIFGIARDTFEDYERHARTGFQDTDMLVMTAGSSVSTRDFTRDVVNSLGKPGVIQHGLAVKPGKPTILAVCDNRPVIGLPGNPVSAFIVARQIVVPVIKRLLGASPVFPATVQATLTANIASTTGRDDTVPVRLIHEGDRLIATPIFGKSNLIYTLVNANGLVQVPLNSNGVKAGTVVDVLLLD